MIKLVDKYSLVITFCTLSLTTSIANANLVTEYYGVQGDGSNARLVNIDRSSGVLTPVGLQTLGFSNVSGLAFRESDSALFGSDTATGSLISISRITGGATAIGGFGVSNMRGISFSPDTGVLYGVSISTHQLYTIDTVTGAASAIGALGFLSVHGIAFGQSGELYGIDQSGLGPQLITIDMTTGSGTAVGALSTTLLRGLTFDDSQDTLLASDIGNRALVEIDQTTAQTSTVVNFTPSSQLSALEAVQIIAIPEASQVLCLTIVTIGCVVIRGRPRSPERGLQRHRRPCE